MLPASSTYTRNHPACFLWLTCSIGPRPVRRPPYRFYVDSNDKSAIFESPFHLRPPMPERDFPISPTDQMTMRRLGKYIRGAAQRGVPLAEDLQRTLEQLRVKRKQEDRGREDAGGGSGDMTEKENGILLIPEGETGGRVRVQNSCHRHLIVVALDEELSDCEWELPGNFPPGQQSTPLLQVWSLSYIHLRLI